MYLISVMFSLSFYFIEKYSNVLCIWKSRYGTEGCRYFYEIDARINDMSRLIEGQVPYVIDATNHGNVSRYINHR